MDKRINKIATAVGAALIGLALVQPVSAQRDPASSPAAPQVEPRGASPAHTSCDALQGVERENCLARQSSPSVTEGTSASAGSTITREPSMDASASAGASIPRSERGLAAEPAFQGSNPANVICDSQLGRARADCLVFNSAGPGLQQGLGD